MHAIFVYPLIVWIVQYEIPLNLFAGLLLRNIVAPRG